MRRLEVIRESRHAGPDFADELASRGLGPLARARATTLQINVGKLCNQACTHCHVEAGPKRTEIMDGRTAARILDLLHATPAVEVVDITGGAPELNAQFRNMVREARARGRRVIDRCNLTVLFERGQEDLAAFLREHAVDIIASLPCYGRDNVDTQRGGGVFDKSIAALQRLNQLDYGQPGGPRLDLVYNPGGAFLPPAQASLEAQYRERLREDFGIVFTGLFTLANMPIKRFAHHLEREGKWDEYMQLLAGAFNPHTLPGLMCRHLVSVSHDGKLYDCDFNQMLELDVPGPTRTIWDIDSFADLDGAPIATASHCYGCTAGAGSSCGGALA